MNCYHEYCSTLNIVVNNEDELTEFVLKKHYHKLCLVYHPDKLKDSSRSSKFQEINNAYNYLSKYMGYMDDDDYSDIEISCDEEIWNESKESQFKIFGNYLVACLR